MVGNSLQKAVFADFLLARNRFRTNYTATFLWDSSGSCVIFDRNRAVGSGDSKGKRVQSAKSHVNFHEESKKEELEKDASESAPSCD